MLIYENTFVWFKDEIYQKYIIRDNGWLLGKITSVTDTQVIIESKYFIFIKKHNEIHIASNADAMIYLLEL